MIAALYNELDPFAATWLDNLQMANRIVPGVVDRRSIYKVTRADLDGFSQVHLFAGIGGWSLALRQAGWPDDVPVWTGSCPCQPFSTAGRRRGSSDDRHLWPEYLRLVRECKPAVLFGEQVASPDGLAWLDLVLTDLENEGYATGAADLCAAGLGAPHIRQRLYFVAMADGERLEGIRVQLRQRRSREGVSEARGGGEVGVVADAERGGLGALRPGEEGGAPQVEPDRHGEASRVADADEPRLGQDERDDAPRQPDVGGGREAGILGDAGLGRGGRHAGGVPRAQAAVQEPDRGEPDVPVAAGAAGELGDAGRQGPPLGPWEEDGSGAVWLQGSAPAETGACNGPWADARWIVCRDPRAGLVLRPAQPGSQPLAHGVPGRVGLIRGYGNAIVPEVAATFVRAVIEEIEGE